MNFPRYKLTDIVVSRHIDAPAHDVFDAWLDPACPASLWEGAEQLLLDPVEGALYYWVVEHEGSLWPHYGRFLIVDRAAGRLEHTWMSPGTHGLETCVSVTFASAPGGGTDFRLVHSGVPDDDLGNEHRRGWTMIADAIADAVSRSALTGAADRSHEI